MFWKAALFVQTPNITHQFSPVPASRHVKLNQISKKKILSYRDNGFWNVSSLMWLWRGIRIVMRRRWKMNPEAFMLSDRLEKLMLASVAASLRSHSQPCRLHGARLKRYFIEVWGRSGRRPSSHRGHIFCPIRLIPAWMADLSNPVTRLALRTCTFCVRPYGSPLACAFFVDFSAPLL